MNTNNTKIKWLIQTSGFQTNYLEITAETLKKLNYNFSDFGFYKNESTIINLDNCLECLDTNYIIRGGTKILSVIDTFDISNLKDFQKENISIYKEKLKNAIDYDVQNFNQFYYSKLDLPLLNKNCLFLEYEKCKDIKFGEDMFIKPSRDLKAFCGGVLRKNTTIEEYVLNSERQSFFKEEIIVINSLEKIYNEYRFFVIGDQIITGSLYKNNDTVIYNNIIPKNILEVAKEYSKLFNPAEIFVMDLAETNKGIFIIEYNCWNCSGLYSSDIQKLFNSVNEFKSKKN